MHVNGRRFPLVRYILVFLSLWGMAGGTALAGVWQVTYEASGSNDGNDPLILDPGAWESNPTPGEDGYVHFAFQATVHAKCSGSVTAVLTWVGSDTPPDKVWVAESGMAEAHTFGGHYDGEFVGSADDGLGHSSVKTPTSWPLLWTLEGVGLDEMVDSAGDKPTYEFPISPGQTVVRLPAVTLTAEATQALQGPVDAQVAYKVAVFNPHPHPCNWHRDPDFLEDATYGTLKFQYQWDSTSGVKGTDGITNPDLQNCYIYEFVTYTGDGSDVNGYFIPTNPPYNGWWFRSPTDSRIPPGTPAQADWGKAQDTHKWGAAMYPFSAFNVPLINVMWIEGGGFIPIGDTDPEWRIEAVQTYRFHCNVCNADMIMPGPDGGTHTIERLYKAVTPFLFCDQDSRVWRYSTKKHGVEAWLDMNRNGFIADSAGSPMY